MTTAASAPQSELLVRTQHLTPVHLPAAADSATTDIITKHIRNKRRLLISYGLSFTKECHTATDKTQRGGEKGPGACRSL